jgi:hypothetical protein
MTAIYLHVGAHKTATTSIQQGLKRYRRALLSSGIKFPLLPGPHGDLEENHSSLLYSLFTEIPAEYHINVYHGIATHEAARQLNEQYKEFLASEISTFEEKVLIFSGEDMVILGDLGIRKLRAFFSLYSKPGATVKVVCYLCSPHDWFASFVQQAVRGGAVLEEAMGNRFPDIRAHLEPFVNHFGKQNVLIRTFEEAVNHKSGRLGHFLSQVSEDFDVSSIQSVPANTGLTAEALQLVSALNKSYRAAGKGPPLGVAREYLAPFLGMRGVKFVLPKSVQERVWREAKHSLEWVESLFGIQLYPEFQYIEPKGKEWGDDARLSAAKLIWESDRT